ncbi:MAG TPA: FHA domain-containing protein, partial [Ktedonobacterales bacterium]|nr:FHA domain-containing protein [Ktedonobacterales bacterium]
LSDFGIATMLEASMAFSRTGSTVGTPQYMAPEQGLPDGIVDARTDVYALGVVLFQCVTGRLPYIADTPVGIIMKHIQEPTPRPISIVPTLPPLVNEIVLRAMEKDQRNRYQTAAEMASDLRMAMNQLTSGVARLPSPTVSPHSAPLTATPMAAPRVATPRGVPGAPGTCFRCGAANNPANRYCTTCAYDLSGARAAADRVMGPNGRPVRCRITFRTGPLTGQSFVLHQDTTTIGRTAGNDIIIQDGTVSRQHARIFFLNNQWVIEDLGSANGTWIDSTRVDRLIPLESGDPLRFGDDFAIFEILI